MILSLCTTLFVLFDVVMGDSCYTIGANVPTAGENGSVCPSLLTASLCAADRLHAEKAVFTAASFSGLMTEARIMELAKSRCDAVGGIVDYDNWKSELCSVPLKCSDDCNVQVPKIINCCNYCKTWLKSMCGPNADTSSCVASPNVTMAFLPQAPCSDNTGCSTATMLQQPALLVLFCAILSLFTAVLY